MDEQLTFRIPRDLARALERRAGERGVPRSQVVREALAAYVAEPTVAPRSVRVWERVQHFVGSMPLDQVTRESDDLSRRIRSHNWRE